MEKEKERIIVFIDGSNLYHLVKQLCPKEKQINFSFQKFLKKIVGIRNFSKETVKSYVYSLSKFLEFSKQKGLNKTAVKDYVQENLKKQNQSSVSKDLFAIKFFFSSILKQNLNLSNPKKNKSISDILTVEEVKK